MTTDDIRLLYEYDRWANDRVIQYVSILTPEQFTRDLGGAFHSVRHTLVHIAAGEWVWLQYWKADSHSVPFVSDLQKRRDQLFSPEQYPTVTAVEAKWREVEKEQIAFVESVTDDCLNRMLPFRTTHVSLAHLMQHVANHSTYHRGQISLMMRQLNAEPIATDFHVFLAEGRSLPWRWSEP
jgi:uncharacterized damage-inducible protein DinB